MIGSITESDHISDPIATVDVPEVAIPTRLAFVPDESEFQTEPSLDVKIRPLSPAAIHCRPVQVATFNREATPETSETT
jgi:hypothetical protein